MINYILSIIIFLIINVFSSLGMANIIVVKGDSWPINGIKNFLSKYLLHISEHAPSLLECTMCCSFWFSLIVDIALFFISGGFYFMWPISGFVSSFCAWFVNEFLNCIDRNKGE